MAHAGNTSGDVHVYSGTTGQRVAHVSAMKVAGPVRGAALSHDCRHLLAAAGNGFLFRCMRALVLLPICFEI